MKRFPLESFSNDFSFNPATMDELGFNEQFAQAETFIDNENPITFSDSEEESNTSFSEASRLAGNRIIFSDIYDNFQSGDLENIREKQPPYVPSMTDDELSAVIEYEITKKNDKDKIHKDKLWLFIQEVAGASWVEPDKYLKSPTSRDSLGGSGRVIASSGGGGFSQISPAQKPTTGQLGVSMSLPGTPLPSIIRSQSSSSSSSKTPRKSIKDEAKNFASVITPQSLASLDEPSPSIPPRNLPRPGIIPVQPPIRTQHQHFGGFQGMQNQPTNLRDVEILNLLQDPNIKDKIDAYISRERMYENLPWIERLETLGVMSLDARLISGMNRAHLFILGEYTKFKSSSSIENNGVKKEDLIFDDELRTLYAVLTADHINERSFFGGTRQPLDKNLRRINFSKRANLKRIGEYNFDKFTRKFTSITSVYGSVQLSALGY